MSSKQGVQTVMGSKSKTFSIAASYRQAGTHTHTHKYSLLILGSTHSHAHVQVCMPVAYTDPQAHTCLLHTHGEMTQCAQRHTLSHSFTAGRDLEMPVFHITQGCTTLDPDLQIPRVTDTQTQEHHQIQAPGHAHIFQQPESRGGGNAVPFSNFHLPPF